MSTLNVLPPAVLIAFAAFSGAWIGSFLNVVVHRLPRMLAADEMAPETGDESRTQDAADAPVYNLAWPGSHCPACRAPIRARHNLPLVGWLWLRGRCADCSAPIPVRYPLLELAGAMACGVAIARFGLSAQGLAAAGVLCTLLALAVIDLEHYLLPDSIVLPLLWLGLITSTFGVFIGLQAAVWGAVAGYVSLRVLGDVWTRLRGVESLGRGDCKLAGAVGAWLGIAGLAEVLVLAGLGTAVFGMAGKRGRQSPLPFGPGIAVGMALVLLMQPGGFRALLL